MGSENIRTTILFDATKRVDLYGCAFSNNKGTIGTLSLRKVVNVSIRNCTFQNNSAFGGGGIYSENSKLVIRDTTFIGNKAFIYGGAIYSFRGSTTLSNVSVSGPGDDTVTVKNRFPDPAVLR